MNRTALLAFVGALVGNLAVAAPEVGLADKVYVWGYHLEKTPSACPFVFGKTDVSLADGVKLFGAKRAVYMNSMFNRGYFSSAFPNWDPEILTNCTERRLSDAHLSKLRHIPELWCAIEHFAAEESACNIARLSLRYPNIVGVNFDDFNDGGEMTAFSPAQLADLRAKIRAINPKLQIMVVSYSRAPDETRKNFDLTPFRGLVDVVSLWRWKPERAYWLDYLKDLARVRAQVGPKTKIVQGLYLHDFSRGMDSREPVPLDIFRLSVDTAVDAVRSGALDGIVLPQIGWYAMPSHKDHVAYLRHRVR